MSKKQPKQSKDKSVFRNFIGFLFVLILVSSLLSLYNTPFSEKAEDIGMNQVAEYIKNNQVEEILVKESTNITVTLKKEEGQEVATVLESYKEPTESLPTILATYGVSEKTLQSTNIRVEGISGWKYFLVNILPVLFPVLFIVLFLWIMLRQVQGSNSKAMMFGQSSAQAIDPDKQKNKTTFEDVAGAEEAKEELMEVVDFLKNPKKFTAIGARIPRGVLMMGAPGTGKTLLARAVAGEADVPFFHLSGSEFVEMFVGVGASRVRDVFRKAKKASPAILFIDEIDAVGRQRGTGLGGSHDEREQTLNQILTEMDGFEEDNGVIVIAATNRPDVLDPALLRPGRFDRRVMIDLPDIREREAILDVHAKNKMFIDGVQMKEIAQRTTGFSGADLMNVLNEAAIAAARKNKKKISLAHCLEAIDKVLLGPQRKNAKFSLNEKEITAYHEAGHALVAHLTPASDAVHKVSIIPRGRAGGFTLKLPEDDKKLHSKNELLADVAVSLGGHAAESLQFGDITTGASSDLEKATKISIGLVTRYGMSEKLGPRTFGETNDMVFLGKEIHEQRNYSEKTAENIDIEVNAIITEQYAYVMDLITKNKEKLDKIAKKLLEVETLEKEEFAELLDGPKPQKEKEDDDAAPASAQVAASPA